MPRHSDSAPTRLIGFGAAAVGVAYLATIVGGGAPAWAPWAVAVGSTACTVGMFVVGAASRGALTRGVRALLASLFVIVAGAFAAALALPAADGPAEAIVLGLPIRLAIVFYGVGLVPLFALPVVFARTFRADDATDGAGGALPHGAPNDAPHDERA